jgi:CYTH domain-containing protein
MQVSLKYAVVERERRFRVTGIPEGVVGSRRIVDHYVDGTRLRLREVTDEDGTTVRKLGHKVRLSDGPQEIACTSLYLDDDEWETLRALPARTLIKTRHIVERDGLTIAVDELEDGSLLAEIDDGDQLAVAVPEWLDVIAEVSSDERWTGARLASS